MEIPTGVHHESDIIYSRGPMGIVVEKQYLVHSPCISWLNHHLSQFYDSKSALPVAQHEYQALSLLAAEGVAPRPLLLQEDSIVMKFAGKPITMKPPISWTSYVLQSIRILNLFRRLGFRHNDLLPQNVLVLDGVVQIIDFTLSEFDGIKIMHFLPNTRWAHPEREGDLLVYFQGRQPRGTTRLLRYLGCCLARSARSVNA